MSMIDTESVGGKMGIEVQNAVEDAILEMGPFEEWADHSISPYGWSVRTPFGVVTVDKDASKLERTDPDGYGEWEEGSEEEVFIIFRVESVSGGDPLFFKKFGTADWYGETFFNGRFRQVFPKQKTVVVYEYE